MKFKYSEYTSANKIKIFRPTVPILFKNKSKLILTEAIVDSGADFTILPIEMAGVLGLKLEAREKRTFYGAGSSPFSVYRSSEKIEHMLRQSGFRTITWKTEVYFAESQPGILLGYKGFLEDFKIVLDGKKKELEVNQ